jgi:hypothetical protein
VRLVTGFLYIIGDPAEKRTVVDQIMPSAVRANPDAVDNFDISRGLSGRG